MGNQQDRRAENKAPLHNGRQVRSDDPETISGDLLTEARQKRGDVTMEEGSRGGVQFRCNQIPLDHYLKSRLISKAESRAANRMYRDFYLSGQTTTLTCNLTAVGGGERGIYLPATDRQREALNNWRNAMGAVKGKIGQLMVLNVCCYGYFLNEINYLPYNRRNAMFRFHEALSDLIEHYKNSIEHYKNS